MAGSGDLVTLVQGDVAAWDRLWSEAGEQTAIARAYIAQLDKARVFQRPIATRVDPLKGFYQAEDAHQDFLINYPDSPYIRINDLPKIVSLKRLFPEAYREQPVRALDSAVHVTLDDARSN